jgi:hypothetical protein
MPWCLAKASWRKFCGTSAYELFQTQKPLGALRPSRKVEGKSFFHLRGTEPAEAPTPSGSMLILVTKAPSCCRFDGQPEERQQLLPGETRRESAVEGTSGAAELAIIRVRAGEAALQGKPCASTGSWAG